MSDVNTFNRATQLASMIAAKSPDGIMRRNWGRATRWDFTCALALAIAEKETGVPLQLREVQTLADMMSKSYVP